MALDGSTHAASTRNLLVTALRKNGQYEEAERVARETLVMREEQLGSEHPHTLLLRSDLALTLHAAGRTTEALTLAEEDLAAGERALGRTPRARHDYAKPTRRLPPDRRSPGSRHRSRVGRSDRTNRQPVRQSSGRLPLRPPST
ncbi:tetratricopeptide repeat protein [Streptomyces spororaveus]|uniref:tetratricopeptide repeat protein n=1 Tax=Streptomyces spororaveus TaxID=284039 RepID=UPI00379E0C6C